jgi:hypothetical protein
MGLFRSIAAHYEMIKPALLAASPQSLVPILFEYMAHLESSLAPGRKNLINRI